MDSEIREKAYRVVAYSAISFSVISVLSVCLTLPMAFNYVTHIQNQMQDDLDYCRVCQLYFRLNCGYFAVAG